LAGAFAGLFANYTGMFHAVETSERFACERKVFEYEYISILNVCVLKQGKCEQSVWDIYIL